MRLYKYMAFGKMVDASLSLLGGEAGKQVHPTMAALPMGWVSSVAAIQRIVCTLVFKQGCTAGYGGPTWGCRKPHIATLR